MKEGQPAPVNQRIVSKELVRQVAQICFTEYISIFLGLDTSVLELKPSRQKPKTGQQTVGQLQQFSEEINGLKYVFKIAYSIGANQQVQVVGTLNKFFTDIIDPTLRKLLQAILLLRATTSEGEIDINRFKSEAEAIARELGLQNKPMREFDIYKVIESVLSDKLKLPEQTQSEKKIFPR